MEGLHTYTDQDWGLLVGLPQSVAVAASAAEPDSHGRSRAEGLAGLTAIAAGRDADSELVRRIAAELVSRVGDPDAGDEAPVITLPDPQTRIAEVLSLASQAVALLAATAAPSDAAAYRHWLITIAEEVAGAAKSGGVLGIGGEWVSPSERQFIADLTVALND